jgi:hypothetical protein
MSVEQPIVRSGTRRSRPWVAAAFLIALAAMTVRLGQFLAAAWGAIRYPWELDYGEGIVWEQMRLMLEGRGYGAIDGLPAIVFHYPPVYHMVSAIAAGLTGADALAAGRAVSIASTLLIGLFAGLIAAKTVRADAGPRPVLACGAVAALSFFCFSPVVFWAQLMRVDMLSIAFSLAAGLLAMAALKRPVLIVASALLFVAAVFTKQTSIVAPAAVFLTYLLLRPRLAWALAGTCVAAGLAALGYLQFVTDGGFARHVFLYNVNRFDAERLLSIVGMIGTHWLFAMALVIGIGARLRPLSKRYRKAGSVAALRQRLEGAPGDAFFLLILVYALLASLMTLTIAKSGSNLNYFIECMAVLAILIGISARDAATFAFAAGRARGQGILRKPAVLPLLIGLQALIAAQAAVPVSHSIKRSIERNQLVAMIGAASRPIISDDMVLLVRSGVPVQWEPAIFAELAKTGAWHEEPFAARVRAGQFAFFITVGERGDELFDSRYNEAVEDAMDAAYPVQRTLAGYKLHLPAGSRAAR